MKISKMSIKLGKNKSEEGFSKKIKRDVWKEG